MRFLSVLIKFGSTKSASFYVLRSSHLIIYNTGIIVTCSSEDIPPPHFDPLFSFDFILLFISVFPRTPFARRMIVGLDIHHGGDLEHPQATSFVLMNDPSTAFPLAHWADCFPKYDPC